MSTPAATDLFLQLWSQGMANDETGKPGTPEWNAAAREHWFRVWLDCSRLAKQIELAQQVFETITPKDA